MKKKYKSFLLIILVCVVMFFIDWFIYGIYSILNENKRAIYSFDNTVKKQFEIYFEVDFPEKAKFDNAELILLENNEDKASLTIEIEPKEAALLFNDYDYLPVRIVSKTAAGYGDNCIYIVNTSTQKSTVIFKIKPQYYNNKELIYDLFQKHGFQLRISLLTIILFVLFDSIPIILLSICIFYKKKPR